VYQGSIAGSFLFAVFGWLIGALGHDAGHFSASRYPVVNDVCVWAMSLLCNPVMWQHQHTYAHHSHTNEFERDPDLHHFTTLIRVHRRFKQQSTYRFQSNWIFVLFAYSFVVFGTCFWIPCGMLREGSLYGIVEWTDRKRPLRSAGMLLHVIGYAGIIMIVPFCSDALSWWSAAAAVIVHLTTSGLLFALFSQINHLNEASLVGDPMISNDSVPSDDIITEKRAGQDTNNNIDLTKSWAVTQVETANNFAVDSALWHVLSNGLNMQIEHHLFPGLNHCHLHRITPVVERTCREYGVRYKRYDTWSDVFQATLRWLDLLSKEDS